MLALWILILMLLVVVFVVLTRWSGAVEKFFRKSTKHLKPESKEEKKYIKIQGDD